MAAKLSRRTVLKGLLGGTLVSVGLPGLDIFLNDNGTAYADGSALPKRFGLFFWGNGVLPDRWVPTTQGMDWALTPQLQPLAAVKDLITVVSGLSVKTGNTRPHESGPAGMLSGAPLQLGDDSDTFIAPSIDQVLASEIGGQTRFRSIEVAVEEGALGRSYSGPNSRNPPEASPYALFQRLFGPGFTEPGEEPIIDPKIALRRSVLDAVMEDSNRLRTLVGSADRARLDQHLQGVRDLELQLARLEEDPPNLAACHRPDEPMESYPPIDARPQMPEINKAMTDILVMALACDQTRVFSNWFSEPVSNILYPGATAGHHQLTHDEPGDQPQVHQIILQIMTQFAYVVEAFSSVVEGDGTLLDNCVILATSDCSYARQHAVEDYPVLLAGSCGGYLRQGIHYRSDAGENTSKLLLTLLRGMDLTVGEFGTGEGKVSDGLPALEV